MSQICIYCGKRGGTTKDHVPPKCFFPSPRPSNLIAVPCCCVCKKDYEKYDEPVRNLLTSLETTENHPGIRDQIAGKRNRSYLRKEGKSRLQHMLNSIKFIDRYSPGRIYLGKHPAFDLDQEVMDRFMERTTRALLYKENSISCVGCKIEWRMAPSGKDFGSMPAELKAFIASGNLREIGNNVFTYVGYYCPGRARSLWIMSFYGGVEFMTILREEPDRKRRKTKGTPNMYLH